MPRPVTEHDRVRLSDPHRRAALRAAGAPHGGRMSWIIGEADDMCPWMAPAVTDALGGARAGADVAAAVLTATVWSPPPAERAAREAALLARVQNAPAAAVHRLAVWLGQALAGDTLDATSGGAEFYRTEVPRSVVRPVLGALGWRWQGSTMQGGVVLEPSDGGAAARLVVAGVVACPDPRTAFGVASLASGAGRLRAVSEVVGAWLDFVQQRPHRAAADIALLEMVARWPEEVRIAMERLRTAATDRWGLRGTEDHPQALIVLDALRDRAQRAVLWAHAPEAAERPARGRAM